MTIGIRDEFEVEQMESYSGSMSAEIMMGSIFDPTSVATQFPPYPVSTLGRVRVADQSSGSVYLKNAIVAGEKMPWSSFYQQKRKYNIGLNFRYSYHYCNSELYADSLVPNPFDIARLNGSKYVWSNFDAIPPYPISLESSVKFIFGYPDCYVTASTTSSLYPTPGTFISDNTWLNSCPFQNRYKGLKPLLNSPVISVITEYTETLPNQGGPGSENQTTYGPDTTVHPSDPTQVSFEFLAFSGSGDTLTSKLTYKTATELFGNVTFSANAFQISQTDAYYPKQNILFKHFFGFGDGFRNQVQFEVLQGAVDNNASASYFYGQGAVPRGWKYGLYNAFPTQTRVIFSRRRYGHLRDMFEQRQYTKFFDPVGINDDGSTGGKIGAKQSAVTVIFISGSASAVSASNPSLYNLVESGIYDPEARVGLPFRDP